MSWSLLNFSSSLRKLTEKLDEHRAMKSYDVNLPWRFRWTPVKIDAGRKGNDVHGNHLQRWLVAGTISLPKCSPVFENTATGWLPHQSLPLKYGSVEYLRIQKSATWSGIERNRPHLGLHCEASIISGGFSIVVAHRCVRILTTWVYSIANHCDSLTTHCTVQVLRKSRKWSWIFVPLKCNDQVGLFCKPYSRCVACCPEPVSQSSLPWGGQCGPLLIVPWLQPQQKDGSNSFRNAWHPVSFMKWGPQVLKFWGP